MQCGLLHPLVWAPNSECSGSIGRRAMGASPEEFGESIQAPNRCETKIASRPVGVIFGFVCFPTADSNCFSRAKGEVCLRSKSGRISNAANTATIDPNRTLKEGDYDFGFVMRPGARKQNARYNNGANQVSHRKKFSIDHD